MNKELKINLLKAIHYEGFELVFNTLTETEDPKLNELVHEFRKAYRSLADYIGYPQDLDLLEPETQM